MRRALRILWAGLLAVVLGTVCAPARAQWIGEYWWTVTHDKKLAASLVAAEGVRAAAEVNLAAQKSYQSFVFQTAFGAESYHALRAYAKFVGVLRMFKQIKHAYKNLDFRGREWALLPQLKVMAPVEIGTDPAGNKIINEREMFSLSMVPPELQTNWNVSDFPDDDFMNRRAESKTFITFEYPHSLGDVQLTFSPSPFFANSVSAEDGVKELMAHSYEALLTAASRLAGYGVRTSPLLLAGGQNLLAGRATPQQIKLQATIYQDQALKLLDTLVQLYVDHGMSINNAMIRVQNDKEFWDGYPDRVLTDQSARAAFAMNMMSEVNMTLARLEALDRRHKDDDTDEMYLHAGQRKNASGIYQPLEEWTSNDFWTKLDKNWGNYPWGDAIRMQLMGITTRYTHSQFEEAQGLRNILAALFRSKAAMDGVQQVSKSAEGILANGIPIEDPTLKKTQMLMASKTLIEKFVRADGWGGTP